MIGVRVASPALIASRSASRLFSPMDFLCSRTLMPTLISRLSPTVCAAPSRIGEAEIEQLARVVQHAMLRQGDKTEHARLGLLVDKFAKAEKIDRPGRAGIHRRRHAGGKAQRVEIAAVGIHAPVTVHVKVDEARRNVAAGDIDDFLRVGARKIGLDRRDPIAGHANVEFLIQLRRRIENRAAGQ